MLEGNEEEKDNEEGKDEDGEKDDEEGETHTGAPRIVHRVGSGCLPNRMEDDKHPPHKALNRRIRYLASISVLHWPLIYFCPPLVSASNPRQQWPSSYLCCPLPAVLPLSIPRLPMVCLVLLLLFFCSTAADIPVIQKIGTTFNCLQYANTSDLEVNLSSVKVVLTTTGLSLSDFILMNKFNKTLEGDIFPTTSITGKRVCIAGYFANH